MNTDRCQSLQCAKAFLLGGGRLLEGFVLLDQILHLVDRVAQLGRHQVRFLRDKPCLGDGSIPSELIHLQDCAR